MSFLCYQKALKYVVFLPKRSKYVVISWISKAANTVSSVCFRTATKLVQLLSGIVSKVLDGSSWNFSQLLPTCCHVICENFNLVTQKSTSGELNPYERQKFRPWVHLSKMQAKMSGKLKIWHVTEASICESAKKNFWKSIKNWQIYVRFSKLGYLMAKNHKNM